VKPDFPTPPPGTKLFASHAEAQQALQSVIGEVLASLRGTPDFPPERTYIKDVIALRNLYYRYVK
jgi:hypothetical protein